MRATCAMLAALSSALALAACGGGGHGQGSGGNTPATSPATAASGRHAHVTQTSTRASEAAPNALVVGLQAPSTSPKASGLWPITVTAHTASGARVNGTVSYAFLLGGSVVARRPAIPGKMRGGVYHDKLEFPPAAVGYPITLEVIVTSRGHRGSTTRAVQVRR